MKKITGARTARYAAIETLYRLDKPSLPLSRLFDQVAEQCRLTPQDRQLAKKISYGVLRQRDYLDLLLSRLCSRPIGQIKPFVHQALLGGLYQLFFLQRIPASAAVDETVKAVQTAGYPRQLQGFVNAVLRQSLRRSGELPQPLATGAGELPILNHPGWLTERWQNRYGLETMQRICACNNYEPILSLRIHPKIGQESYLELLSQHSIEARAGSYAPEAVLLPDFQGMVTALPGFKRGFFQVQDQAAQLATLLLAPFSPAKSYLDGCAGLGGKTTHLATLLPVASSLTAVEPDGRRYRQLQKNLRRLPSSDRRIEIRNESLQDFCRTCTGRFDSILIDAPCSGTGVIGRQPDIRWRRQPEDLLSYQQIQLELLLTAAAVLAPGGTLVYATCSIEAEENQEVVELFLQQVPDFSLSDCSTILPPSARSLVQNGCFSPVPGREIDGFFAARLTRAKAND